MIDAGVILWMYVQISSLNQSPISLPLAASERTTCHVLTYSLERKERTLAVFAAHRWSD
jgi:hypothetical protein